MCYSFFFYLSFFAALGASGDVMVDQIEHSTKSRQVIRYAARCGIQPEPFARVVDAHTCRPFVRLDAQRVQVIRSG